MTSRPPTLPPRLWAAAVAAAVCGVCGLYGSRADAVLAPTPSRNVSASRVGPDGLETSQTRVNQVDGPPVSGGHRGDADDDRASGKDYDGGYSGHNSYGPPRDYYYDERPPEHFRPPPRPPHVGHRPPGESVYHQYPPTEHQHYYPQHHHDSGGEVHRPGELNVQPLLLPLAGVALLGVLSALVKAPLLLHLGSLGHRRRRRRRRRDTVAADDGAVALLKSLADKFNDQGQRIANLQSCLVCDVVASAFDRNSSCAERSVCEVMSRKGSVEIESDKRLLSAMIAQVLENDQIPKEFRKRLESAAANSRNTANCKKLYPCANGEDMSKRE